MKSIKMAVLSLFAASAAAPALAADWSEQFGLCVSAVEEQGYADTTNYKPKFVSAGGAATKRLLVKFISNNGGEDIVAECRIRRGEVKEVSLKS